MHKYSRFISVSINLVFYESSKKRRKILRLIDAVTVHLVLMEMEKPAWLHQFQFDLIHINVQIVAFVIAMLSAINIQILLLAAFAS